MISCYLFLRVGGASSLKVVDGPDPGWYLDTEAAALRWLVEEDGASPNPCLEKVQVWSLSSFKMSR